MKSFREYIAEQDAAGQAPAPIPQQVSPLPQGYDEKRKKWSASKTDILDYWKTVQPNMPITARPIQYSHKGSTYGEDGIRITGSPNFISTVISHLKDFLSYESQRTKLAVSYRETESPSKVAAGQNKTSFVFYIAVKERGQS